MTRLRDNIKAEKLTITKLWVHVDNLLTKHLTLSRQKVNSVHVRTRIIIKLILNANCAIAHCADHELQSRADAADDLYLFY